MPESASLAGQLPAGRNIDFGKTSNAFLKCGNFARLQELADSLTPRDLLTCGRKWLATFTPFFKEQERKQSRCQHRLFFAQVEYCDNLIFHRRAALDALGERLLDANRTIGQPDKITVIFGRKITSRYRESCRRKSKICTCPIQSSAATTATVSSSSTFVTI
jgi:hypothetical protein